MPLKKELVGILHVPVATGSLLSLRERASLYR